MKNKSRIKDAKISKKGQITVPKEVRERLGVKSGDRVVFYFDDNEVKITSTDNTKIVVENKEKEISINKQKKTEKE